MGRKIPAKKHKGVKDPLEQQAKRLQLLKGKINAPPKDPDEQPIPRSLTDLFAFQNRDKTAKKEKKKQFKQKLEADKSSASKSNPLRGLRRLPGESGRGFSLRINSAVRALHDPTIHTNYPEDTEKDDVKGYRMAEQRERRERKRKKAEKQARIAARAAGGEGVAEAGGRGEAKLTKTQKLALKRKAKKVKAAEALSERSEVTYEHIQFGEVTHAPPALPPPRRRDPALGAPRPGRRDLLLTSLLNKGNTRADSDTGAADTRRLDADKQRREVARLDAVAAYRKLKAEKINNKHK